MDEQERRVLLGQVTSETIPPIPRSVVRVFVCSAGSDTVQERTALVEKVYPAVREYCREKYGLEFHAVDLHWGHEDERYPNNHSKQDFLIREIKRCHQMSEGPNFLMLLGQRLGSYSLPASIDDQEYRQIRHALKKHKGRQTRNWSLLEDWYEWNGNSLPQTYSLKPISSNIPGYTSSEPSVRQESDSTWEEVHTELLRLLQKGAEWCHVDGVFDEDTKEKYFLSDLESQAHCGIFAAEPNSAGRCLVVTRNIMDLKNFTGEEKAAKYTELLYNERKDCMEIDTEARNRLISLATKLEGALPDSDVAKFDVLWRFDDVITPRLHQEYLDNFCKHVEASLKRLTDEQAKDRQPYGGTEIFQEVHQHWIRCKGISDKHFGRDDLINRINRYLLSSASKPLVIYGASGVGKTSIVSKCCLQVQDMFPKPVITVLRYVGYTPQSSNLRQLLMTLCSQLTLALDEDPSKIPTGCSELVAYFHSLLESVPRDYHLIIFLDALSQIRADYNAHELSWIPKRLKENVGIVISIRSDKAEMLNRFQRDIIQDPEFVIEINSLNSSETEDLLAYFLERDHRRVSEEQTAAMKPLLQLCRLPLYVKMISEYICKQWVSSQKVMTSDLPETLGRGVLSLLKKLEKDFGQITSSHILGYLVASQTGLSSCELEDVLSLDDAVLDEIYGFKQPLVRRIPPWVWSKMRDRLSPFLSTKETDGVTVFFLSHEMFVEFIKERYLTDTERLKSIHSILGDYFLGRWACKAKPYMSVRSIDSQLEIADRLVPAQPHTFTSSKGVIIYNRRKYDQVPRHLFLSDRLAELNQVVLFSYDWLYNKTKALSLQQTLIDLSFNQSKEATLVGDCLSSSQTVIERNIRNLATEITGHLLPHFENNSNIRQLIRNCDRHGLKHNAIVSLFPYHVITGSSLQCTLEATFQIDDCFLTSDEKKLLVKGRDTAKVITCNSVNCESKQTLLTSTGDMHVTPDGQYIVIVDHITEKTVKLHNAEDGRYIGQLVVLNHIEVKPKEKYHMSSVCVSNQNVCLVVTTDISYLCIAEIPSCNFLQIVQLEGRSSVCSFNHDASFLFCNSAQYLMIYDLVTLKHTSTTTLSYSPKSIALTQDGRRCFLSNEFENKISVLHLTQGKVDIIYKAVLEDWMEGDHIKEVKVSPNDNLILARGSHNLVIYDRKIEKVTAHFPRPSEALMEFKLPKCPFEEMGFTHVSFSGDSKYLFGTIFRNIYMWELSTCQLITTIQTPPGTIKKLIVSQTHGHVYTMIHGLSSVQVWSVQEVTNKVDPLDQLSSGVTDIHITSDQSLAFVTCSSGEEIAVVEMNYGTIVDLLTHESAVEDFALTPSGNNLLVSTKPKWSNCAVKIWDVPGRQIISEFGNTVGFCVPFKEKNALILVAQEDLTFKAPYHITQFRFDYGTVEAIRVEYKVPFLLSRPFVTPDDRYLVMLTAADYAGTTGMYDKPTVTVVDLDTSVVVRQYTPESFQSITNIVAILDVRVCPLGPNVIAIIYMSKYDKINSGQNEELSQFGLFVLDIAEGDIKAVCEPFMDSGSQMDTSVLLAKDFSFAIDAASNIFDTSSLTFTGKVSHAATKPSLLALDYKVIVYAVGSSLKVVRIKDLETIVVCETHSEITCVRLCGDERTLAVGCSDGTLLSYVIIDPDTEDVEHILGKIVSRKYCTDGKQGSGSGRSSRAWDRVNDDEHIPGYSRPPSARSTGPNQKQLLEKIRPVNRIRPKSESYLYMNDKSVTCSVM